MSDAKKILVIDDDADVHAILKAALGRAGYQVVSALDAMQGAMQARLTQPDLIILDVMMPAGGGLSVYQRLKQMQNTVNVPVLLYTAVPLEQLQEKIPPSENLKILIKPVPMDDMLAAIREMLHG